MGQGGLFYREERTNFVAAWADNSDRARNDEVGQIASGRKARPANAINTAPVTSILRRPIRSARVVRYNDTTMSPPSVRVRSKPVSDSDKPKLTR